MPLGIVSENVREGLDAVGVRFREVADHELHGTVLVGVQDALRPRRLPGFKIMYYLVYYRRSNRAAAPSHCSRTAAAAASGSPARIARAIRSCCAIDGRMSPKTRI